MKFPPWLPELTPDNYDFDYVAFRKAVKDQGGPIQWDHGVPCPCRQKVDVGYSTSNIRVIDTHEPNTLCLGCKGTGVLLVNSQPIIGVLSQFGEANKFHQNFGRLAPGEAFLTLLPEHVPDMDDRFTMLDRTIPVSDSLIREGDVSELRFPIATKVVELGDENDPTVLVLTEVRVIDLRVAALNGVYTPAPSLVEGLDFEVVDGKIAWALGDERETAPAVGASFSARYYANPIYKVSTLGRVCRDTQVLAEGQEVHGSGPAAIIVSPMYRGYQRTSD